MLEENGKKAQVGSIYCKGGFSEITEELLKTLFENVSLLKKEIQRLSVEIKSINDNLESEYKKAQEKDEKIKKMKELI